MITIELGKIRSIAEAPISVCRKHPLNSVLDVTDMNRNTVRLVMPPQLAWHMEAAFAAFIDGEDPHPYAMEAEEPEPLDAETVAAREHSHDSALCDAGRGHLVRT